MDATGPERTTRTGRNSPARRTIPILVLVHIRLARSEERAALASFGEDYRRYMEATPAFLPRVGQHREIKA